MNREERKKLVETLLAKAKNTALEEAEIVKKEPNLTYAFVYAHLRKYILSKYLLGEDVEEDNIRELAKLSLEKTMNLDRRMLHQLDQATPCDHATSESTKKVLLLYSIQKDFEIHPDAERYTAVESVVELAKLVYNERKTDCSDGK